MGIYEALGAVDQQGGVFRFGIHPALGVITKELLHEPIVTPASVSHSHPPLVVGLLWNTGRHLTQTFNVTVLKLVKLGHRLFSSDGLSLTEGPPPTELGYHVWYEFVRDGLVDGF